MAAIDIDNLADVIMEELQSCSKDIAETVKEEVKEAAKNCVTTIKKKSPEDTGKYKKGWTSKVEFENKNGIRIKVYNRTKPQLTHLLENGYAKRNGGRVVGKAHIAPAEKEIEKELMGKVKVAIR